MHSIPSKLPNSKPSIFSTMSALAQKEDALNLSQGFPDFDIDPILIRHLNEGMKKGYNQYAPMAGLPILREQIARKTYQLHGKKYDIDTEITVVPGATLGLFAAISAIVNTGDEIIIFDPAYDSYAPAIELNGGKTIHIPLQFPDFTINWAQVQSAVNAKTKLIILNSPHNPSGATLSRFDLSALNDIVKGTEIILISDEVYEHIIFDGKKHLSLSGDNLLAERSFIISSFGKTYHTTGWKMGYVLAPAPLTKIFREGYQFMAFSAHTPTQYAFAKILADENSYLDLAKYYERKRNLFRTLISSSRFDLLPTHGSYFQLLSYRKITNEADTLFAERLTKEFKIASIPISVFYKQQTDHKILRFCFAKRDKTLIKAAAILCRI